ncbi:hypothetical protein O6H91_10G007100 [Diphasiastrum complanatum]|uniref:Uncharacterized protein n=1 Tax=Diphasiastrum complanatum TaxID=34168 RepID=A0ACC2CDZ2_DIPCM|nr:hypothetical protein O6H91_Y285400 [Diphasiastrum complanatum]KAJ7292324.1 hypothetical protein O6H91_Y285400 [Diphasiastrum complanatum]KAJ7540266.1 hypothetical protein O6H91_10G007100 [Diphasiastrum complanatum]
MGSILPSHMDQGVIFGVLGLWHVLNTLNLYIKTPRGFRYRTWFPVKLPWTLRFLELWIILLIIVMFICTQMSHARADISSGIIQAAHIQRFQHVTFALFFLVYAAVGLVSEQCSMLPLPPGVLHSTFALGFLLELLVFHFGHHPGETLENFVHMFMQIILLFLVSLMFLEILWPRSFVISIARCMLLILKGTWFFDIGILINVPSSIPLGCVSGAHGFPVCPVGEALMRAKSLQVLVFGCQMLGIVIGTYLAYALLNQFLIKGPYLQILEDVEESGSKVDAVEEDEAVPIISVIARSLSIRGWI